MLDDKGLTEADYVLRDELIDELDATSHEKKAITNMLVQWHKGWSKVVNAGQKRFNLMRRLQEANDEGYCQCCCTGKWIHYTKLDAGHYIPATKQPTRFHPLNVWPQSKASNSHGFGNKDERKYTRFMQEKFGWDFIDDLYEFSEEKGFTWRDRKKELIVLRVGWERSIKDHKKRLGV